MRVVETMKIAASQIAAEMCRMVRGDIRISEPLSYHTSFKIGGPADLIVFPVDEEDMCSALDLVRLKGIPHYILGSGTNVLASDEGFRGVVVKTERLTNLCVSARDGAIEAGAGCRLQSLCSESLAKSLSGLEFAAGIPGTVGGAITMNAGTREGCVGDVVKWVRVITPSGAVEIRERESLQFGYRKSVFLNSPEVVLSAEFSLTPDERRNIEDRMKDNIRWRHQTQPIGLPSAGSVFMNPTGGESAGRLIELAGLKGMRVGDAQVSEVHANFIVNLGRANAQEVLRLMDMIQERVLTEFGIQLEPEIRLLGMTR